METDILLTVLCTTFNHEAYVADALRGFVEQEADFRFKVLVHDDASSDGTVNIIKEYVLAYPKLFDTIFQTENQYSKGVDILFDLMLPRVYSKYIAICEGDDYWDDPSKLQKQVSHLERHSECSLCVCASEFIDGHGKVVEYQQSVSNNIFSTEQIIAAGGGGLFHTASFVFRSEMLMDYPIFLRKHSFSDYPLSIYLSLRGTVCYLGDKMAVHRVNLPNSWTQRVNANNVSLADHYLDFIALLTEIDEYTAHKYHQYFEYTINKCQYQYHMVCGDRKKAKELDRERYFDDMRIKRSLKEFLMRIIELIKKLSSSQ